MSDTTSTIAPVLTSAEVAELIELVAASQTKGAGLDKVVARHELDQRCAVLFVEGATLRELGEALGVTESSIHTRVTRIRALELDGGDAPVGVRVEAPAVEAEVEEAPAVIEPEEVVEETAKQRKARLARERRAAANARKAEQA